MARTIWTRLGAYYQTAYRTVWTRYGVINTTNTDFYTISIPSGNLTLSESSPDLSQTTNSNIEVPSGNLILSQSAPEFNLDLLILVPSGDLTLSESSPNYEIRYNIEIPSGNLVLSESSPDVLNTSPLILELPRVDLNFTTYAPELSFLRNLRISQIGLESWIRNNPKLRVSQVGIEVWRTGEDAVQPKLIVSQVGVEVWYRTRLEEGINVLILAG